MVDIFSNNPDNFLKVSLYKSKIWGELPLKKYPALRLFMTFDLSNFDLQIRAGMTCSLFLENSDFLDQLPLENIWSNSTCNSKYGVSSTRGSSMAVVVKNLNCIFVYSDILKYKHVTKNKFFAEWDDILWVVYFKVLKAG